MGGFVFAKSRGVGFGSSFYLCLPHIFECPFLIADQVCEESPSSPVRLKLEKEPIESPRLSRSEEAKPSLLNKKSILVAEVPK
jgi:hypothetical protein